MRQSRGEAGHVAWWAVALGAVLGWLLLIPVSAFMLWLDGPRFAAVDSADMRPLLAGLDMLGGVPTDTAARAVVLLRHPDGADAGIAAVRRNAASAGWELLDEAAISPGGTCAIFDAFAEDVDELEVENRQRVRELIRGEPPEQVYVVTFTTMC